MGQKLLFFPDIYTKHKNTSRGHNVKSLDVKHGGIQKIQANIEPRKLKKKLHLLYIPYILQLLP